MLPVKKKSLTRKRTRRSHMALKPKNYSICPRCSHAKLPHAACECGYVNPKIRIKRATEETA